MRVRTLAAAVTLCLAINLFADEPCGDAVDEALFSAKSWSDLGAWFDRYPDCDDGSLAEHVSGLVGEWLSAGPEQLATLDRAARTHPSLMKLVARHIDMTLGQDTTSRIRHHAERECPSSAARTCRWVIQALDDLEEEVRRRTAVSTPSITRAMR